MKNTVYLLTLLILISCNPFSFPSSAEREILKQEIQPRRIETICTDAVESGKGLTVYASPKGPEALEFLSYIIPLLHGKGDLSLRLWFLENSSDDEIRAYMEDEDGAASAEDLLRRADPRLCGFLPYRDFLEKLKAYYAELEEDKESFIITSSDDIKLDLRLYNGNIPPDEERSVYLINSPLKVGRHWELPFGGILYSMMIHEWPLREYGAVAIDGNSLGSAYLTSQDARDDQVAADQLDGMFLMSYPREYLPMTRIEGFVNEENIAEVLEFFPGQLIREKTGPASFLVNSKIQIVQNRDFRKLEKLYEAVREEIPGYTEP